MSKLYSEMNNGELDRLKEELENSESFSLTMDACDWFFPNFQRIIIDVEELIKKDYSFKIIIDVDDEVSTLCHLAIFLTWRYKSNKINDIIKFSVKSEENINDLTRAYEKVSRFLILFIDKYNLGKNLSFVKIPEFAEKYSKEGSLWPYEKGGFGKRGMPLIPLDKEVYYSLQKNFYEFIQENKSGLEKKSWKIIANKNKESLSLSALREICRNFNEEFQKIKISNRYDFDKNILKILNYADVLTFIIFASAFFGIYNPGSGSKTLNERKQIITKDDRFIALYERCCAYSLGILQLVENTINYTSGGFLSIRVIIRDDKYLQSVLAKPIENEDCFIAISVCDVANQSCGKYLNMAENFSETLKLRKNEPSVKELLGSKEINNVDIKDMFFPANNAPLLKYLKEPINTGYHYGLQIFASSVESANGNFIVISGNNSKTEYAALFDNTENKNIKNCYLNSDSSKCIYYCGTKYDILLPVSGILKDAGKKDTFPVPNELSYEALPDNPPFTVKFDSKEYINIIMKNKGKMPFEFKPIIVNMLADDIIQASEGHELLHELEPLIICFEGNYRASTVLNLLLEIIAKAVFILLSNDKFKYRNIVLCGFGSSMHIAAFIRYYAQFYDRFGYNGSLATKSQILLIMDHGNGSESIVLSGRYIGRPMYEYQVFSGGKANEGRYLKLTLDSISVRTVQKVDIIDHLNNPHCFDSIELKDNGRKTKRWILDLKSALTTDFSDCVHVGSKIKNCVTHMHVSGVHIDTFYQIDQIFTNAYWAVKISQWILEKISLMNADGSAVLYGYGHLMESVLHNVVKGNKAKFEYVIYDEGYHYTAEKVSQPNLSFSCKKQTVIEMIENGSTVVFVMPISTTLSSFNRMGDKLFSECCNKSYNDFKPNVEFIAVFQVIPDNDESAKVSKLFFSDQKNGTVISVKSIISERFSNKCDCSYLLSLPAKWQKPEECIFCYPDGNQYERMLYTTDDTSLVPTMQLQDYNDNIRENTGFAGLIDFFERKDGKYIYSSALIYSHIERQDAHFAHYIQTRLLLNAILENGSFDEQAEKIVNELFKGGKSRINIIVAPSHSSNQKFPVKINDSVFDGKAHIISVNAKKIYRSNFEAEYSNYSSLISRIFDAVKRNGEKFSDYVKFYYVDDHINSGTTFFRMKSLMRSMFNYALEKDEDFNFDAVITLVDRHSASSVKDYINSPSRLFSFFKFNIPAVRSNGDSCPLCKRVFTDKALELCAALDETANICAERRNAHNVKEISRYKSDFEKHDKSKEQDIEKLSQRHMRRFEAENILWTAIAKTEKDFYKSGDSGGNVFCGKMQNEIITTFFDKISSPDLKNDRIEYLISFVKALSRPFLSFRPFVATAAIGIIRDICDCLLQCDLSKKTVRIVFNYKKLSLDDKFVVSSKKELSVSASKDAKLELINLLIVCLSGLSELNSTYILDTEKIKGICGFYENASCGVDMYDPFPGTKESANDKRSFADYVRFSIFRLVHHEKFGETRRKKFDECLENILKGFSSADNNLEKLISLIYLENGAPCRKVSSALEILHDEIIEDIFDNNKVDSLDSEYEKTLANSIAYIDENDVNENNNNGIKQDNTDKSEPKDLILTPITTRGYCDAYNIGFDLHFRNKIDHQPIVEAYNVGTKQLWGKIRLSDEAVKNLKKFGISVFNFSDEKVKNSYIFLKFSNKSVLSVWSLNDESDILTQMPPLYLRIRVENNTSYLALLKTIRAIISQRNMILKNFAVDLTTEDMNRLIAERRFNRALSITKASKHATEESERTLNYKGTDEKILPDRLIGQIRRLLANRTISTLYQVESMIFERENRDVKIAKETDFKKLYDDSEEIGGYTKLRLWAENDHEDKYTQIWDIIGKDDFFIYGTKDANTSHNVKLKFDIKSLVSSTYSYSLKYNAIQEKKLMLDIIFLLANNAIRHLPEDFMDEELPFTIRQEGQFLIVSSPVGETDIDRAIIKTARAMVIPPHVRKYFINKANNEDGENANDTDGITLWTLARYFRRLEKYTNPNGDFSIIPIKHANNKYEFGFKYFSVCFNKTNKGYDFLVKMKCLEGRANL